MYKSKLSVRETQKAIKYIKDTFEKKLSNALCLERVSAPMMVISNEGINDDLGIKNSALSFKVDAIDNNVEIVQSLAKWKRIALKKYEYKPYEGIYTDMNAIRPKEELDKLHSLYVDQWDWEMIIEEKDRNENYLENIIRKIILSIYETKESLRALYPSLTESIEKNIFFIDSEDLYNLYPSLTSKERENEITKLYRTVFIKKIGKNFKNGLKHDNRAFDYDDWSLNGDILIWSDTLKEAVEISSMGIRVNKEILLKQKGNWPVESIYHKMILKNELPQTMGGGIGQSRLSMVLLEKMHIAEVQATIWDEKNKEIFRLNNIIPL